MGPFFFLEVSSLLWFLAPAGRTLSARAAGHHVFFGATVRAAAFFSGAVFGILFSFPAIGLSWPVDAAPDGSPCAPAPPSLRGRWFASKLAGYAPRVVRGALNHRRFFADLFFFNHRLPLGRFVAGPPLVLRPRPYGPAGRGRRPSLFCCRC